MAGHGGSPRTRSALAQRPRPSKSTLGMSGGLGKKAISIFVKKLVNERGEHHGKTYLPELSQASVLSRYDKPDVDMPVLRERDTGRDPGRG